MANMKLLTLIITFSMIVVRLDAQYTQLRNVVYIDQTELSPAYFGLNGNTELVITNRQLYALHNYDYQVRTGYLSASTRIFDKAGLGMHLFFNKIGFFQDVKMCGAYAYHVNFSRKAFLDLSLHATYNSRKIVPDDSQVYNDPYFNNFTDSDRWVEFGAAILFRLGHQHFGLNVSNINRQYLNENSGSFSGDLNFNDLLLHYRSQFGFGAVVIEPVVFLYSKDPRYTEPNPWLKALSLVHFWDVIHLGAGISTLETASFSAGITLSEKYLLNATLDYPLVFDFPVRFFEISLGILLGENKEDYYNQSIYPSVKKQAYFDWVKQ